MKKFGVKRFIACVALVGATAGVWYGTTHLTGVFGAQTKAEDPQETEEAPETETPDMTSVWTPPEVAPAESDYAGRIEVGDFSVLTNADAETLRELEETFSSVRPYSRYIDLDADKDGQTETVWLTELEDTLTERVVAVFAHENQGARLILFSPSSGGDEYYLTDGDSLYYVRNNDWIISEYHCTEILFDREYEMYAGDALSMYMVEDASEYESGVDAAIRRRMTFIDGAGVWYQACDEGQDASDARRVHADEWLSLFADRTGTAFAEVAPDFEAKRSGIETGVGAYIDTVRRSGYATAPFVETVRYPQMTTGAKLETINRLLKDAAFSLSVGEEHTADALIYLRQLKNDGAKSQQGDVYYRVANNADDMISIQYGLSRTGSDIDDVTKVALLTIEKSSGRQIQIGDLTTIDTVIEAAGKGYGELFYLRAGGTGLSADTEKSHDAAWMRETVDRTRNTTDGWKNIGLDEQYLYLAVATHDDGNADAILRIPRWRINMASPGHMELLTMHPAYPYLKETLDSAQSLTVRKKRDGFDIAFLTADGGRVQAELTETDTRIPEGYATSAVRDYLIDAYPDVTGVVIGTLSPDAAEDIDFYLVDSSLGAIGRVLLQGKERTFEVFQSRFNTNSGVLSAHTDMEGGMRMEIAGELKEDASGYAVWHDMENDSYRLTRSISGSARFVFELTPLQETDTEDGEATVRVDIRPEDADYAAETYEIAPSEYTFTFRDINGDGYADLTIGTIDPADHGDEYNFLFFAALQRYVPGPEELRTADTYVYDAGSGYLVTTSGDTDALYETAADGSLVLLRTLKREEITNGVYVTLTGYEDGDEESSFLLLDTTVASGDRDILKNIDLLFRTEYVHEVTLSDADEEAREDADEEEEDAPDYDRRYALATRQRIPDIIWPYDIVRVYAVDTTEGILGMEQFPYPEDMDTVFPGVLVGIEEDVYEDEEVWWLYFDLSEDAEVTEVYEDDPETEEETLSEASVPAGWTGPVRYRAHPYALAGE